jgi:hypothetical protein
MSQDSQNNEPFTNINNVDNNNDNVNNKDNGDNGDNNSTNKINIPDLSHDVCKIAKDSEQSEKIKELEKNFDEKLLNIYKTVDIFFDNIQNNLIPKIKNDIIVEMENVKENAKENKNLEGIEKLKKEIIDDMILPDNKNYIASSIFWIKIYNVLSAIFVALKYILMILVVPTLTFASTTFTDKNLNFVAGILSLCGIGFEKLSLFCSANAKKRNEKMNKMIEALGIEQKVIDTTYEDPMDNLQKLSQKIASPIKDRNTTHSVAQKMMSKQYEY